MRGDGRGTFFGLTLSLMVVVGVALVFCAAALVVGRSLYVRLAAHRVSATSVTTAIAPSETSLRTAETSPTPAPSRTPSPSPFATALESSPVRTLVPTFTARPRATGTLPDDGNRATATTVSSATPSPTPTPADAVTLTAAPDGAQTPSTTATATPEPTATVTPVAPTILPTSMPTHTPLARGWTVRGETVTLDSDGDVRVIGEVLNNTSLAQENIELEITFYDGGGQAVGQAIAWPVIIVLPPGVAVPFETAERLRTGFTRFEIEITADATSEQARQDLKLIRDSSTPGNPYVIVGEVGNSGPDLPADGCAWIIGTLYDSTGNVAGMGYAGVQGPQLRSGQMARFELEIGDPLPGVSDYALVVLGYSDC